MKKLLLILLLIFISTQQTNAQQTGFLGEVKMFAGNFAPRGWAFCEGQLLAISSNTALFSIIGTIYGGDGRTTFGLPDLRGRSAIGVGRGPGLSTIVQGTTGRGGVEEVTLTNLNLPSHSHTIRNTGNAVLEKGNTSVPTNNYHANTRLEKSYHDGSGGVTLGNTRGVQTTTEATGNQRSFNIRDPYLGIRYIICVEGVFPSRN